MQRPGSQSPQGETDVNVGPGAAIPPLAESLFGPLVAARELYEAAQNTLEGLVAGLDALMPPALKVARSAPPVPGQSPSAEIVVSPGAGEAFLQLREAIAALPGVLRVTISAVDNGRATLAVELQAAGSAPRAAGVEGDAGLSVVCAWCGKLLSLGGARVSHGLCEDCAARAEASARAPEATAPGAPPPAAAAPATLVYLFRSGDRWLERRIFAGDRHDEAFTGFPASIPAHEVLERMSARYPEGLVVVSGDGGATLAGGGAPRAGAGVAEATGAR